MKKTDIQKISIELTVSGKPIFRFLADKDGSLSRQGDGIPGVDMGPAAVGKTDGSIFSKLVEKMDEATLEKEGVSVIDVPDKTGEPLTYNVVFMGEKPHLAAFECNLGTQTQHPTDAFLYFDDIVGQAKSLTEEWYTKVK
jgi:hypothetical protein